MIDSVKSLTEILLYKNGLLEKETRDYKTVARYIRDPREDPDSSRGIYSDLLSSSILLRLITSSWLDEVYRYISNTR